MLPLHLNVVAPLEVMEGLCPRNFGGFDFDLEGNADSGTFIRKHVLLS